MMPLHCDINDCHVRWDVKDTNKAFRGLITYKGLLAHGSSFLLTGRSLHAQAICITELHVNRAAPKSGRATELPVKKKA